MKKQVIAIVFFVLPAKILSAQTCTIPGQTPVSAIRVCGSTSYGQSTVLSCGVTDIPVACPSGGTYQNTDPYWYKLACYSSGTLGFVITPNNLNDNYDWQLFDITGRNPVDVFTAPSTFVACNWSSDPGETGTSIDGTGIVVCSGFGQPLFNKMPDLVAGREYLLMISNHDHTQRGFQISFAEGTAGITDGAPGLLNARSSCDGTQVIVMLNKLMQCNTVAPNGTDFTISGGVTITSATALSCLPGGGSDSVLLSLSSPLPAGNYIVTIKNGTDGNTMTDLCDRDIVSGEQTPFVVTPMQPTLMDSVYIVTCSPTTIQLIFSRPILCSSIATNGSDFIVTGPQPVVVTGIFNGCTWSNPVTASSIINLLFASPIVTAGVYQVTLVSGSDGNTIIDECGRATPAGSSLSFMAKTKPSATFTYSIKTNCKKDTLTFIHDGLNGVNSWNWSFDNTSFSNLQSPVMVYPAKGQHTVKLIVSNGGCKDTVSKNIVLDNQVIAAFEAPAMLCPEDTLGLINKSTGKVDIWQWNFGNGITSNLHTPLAQHFPFTGAETFYMIKLVATNTSLNCADSITHGVRALGNCYIAVPSAFTPNDDGLNDYLYPLNALKADNLEFKVYNRMGQLVFVTKDWTRKWNGKIKGVIQNTGVYAWTLSFIHHDTGKKIFMKGTTLLIR